MHATQLLGAGAVAVAVVLAVGAPISLVALDDPFLGAPWRVAAVASLGIVVGLVVVFFVLGRPWKQTLSTRYW